MFEEGMRVRLLKNNPDGNQTYVIGSEGVVCDVINKRRPGIRWDEHSDQAHDCDGYCDHYHGWYVDDIYLEIISEEREFADIEEDAFSALLYS